MRRDATSSPELRVTLTGDRSEPSESEIRFEVAAPGGDYVRITTVRPDSDPVYLTVRLSDHFGLDLPAGTWRARAVDGSDPARVLAETTFFILPTAGPLLTWDIEVTPRDVPSGSCDGGSPSIELRIRTRNASSEERHHVYAVLIPPTGEPFVAPAVALGGNERRTVRLALCAAVAGTSVPLGTWRVELYRVGETDRPIAEATFRTIPPLTPTPLPEPQLE